MPGEPVAISQRVGQGLTRLILRQDGVVEFVERRKLLLIDEVELSQSGFITVS